MDHLLRSIYYDVRNAAAFGGIDKLLRAAKEQDPGITREQVDEWLRGETVYTLHRQATKNYRHNPVISHCVGEWCQADIADMSAFAAANDGYAYLLTFIDVFSRRAAAIPLRTKSGKEVSQAFEKIFSDFVCFNLLVDRGTEFKNDNVKRLMDKYGCRMAFAYNESVKASVAERWNRTLKEKLFKYMTSKGTRRYVDVLAQIVLAYNMTRHSRTGERPVDVSTTNNQQVFERTYGFKNEKMREATPEPATFAVGHLVRVRYSLPVMAKSYFPRFSDQVYTVTAVLPGFPRTMYRLKNWNAVIMPRKYYAEDLLRVTERTKYRIQRVLKRQKGRALVKWIGYPKEANTWIRGPGPLAAR